LFTLTGVEGHIFGPMAKTYAYAIAGGLLATFTVTIALSAVILPNQVEETETFVVRHIRRLYEPALKFALENRVLTLGGGAVAFAIAMLAGHSLGLEFLPHLEEGNFWIRAEMPPSISLETSNAYVNRMRETIKSFPEVETAISQHGRPDDGTDTTGFFNAEFFVPLKPFDTWPNHIDKAHLTAQLNARLEKQFPGVDFNFSQNIQDNVEEAASGVKGENSVKVFGNDLASLQRTAERIKTAMSTVPGIADLAVFNSLGQPTVQIEVDRARAARYGLAPGDINATVQTAIGGQTAGNLYEQGSDRNFPIMVRLSPEYRQSLDSIGRITVAAPNPGGTGLSQIPLSDVATIKLVSGASFVYRENQQRYVPIKFSVRGRDLGGAVLEAQNKVARDVRLPSGARLEWVGELGDLQNALSRLAIVIPISLLLIGLLLFMNFSLISDTLLSISVIPMAMIGGILALFLTHTPLSVSATIGFIGLFGVSVMNGIIVVTAFNSLIEDGLARRDAILQACHTQLRPVLMTCTAACVGLLPAAFATGIGSQVQKPLALVVVGGILLAPALILLVLPVLLEIFSKRVPPRRAAEGARHPSPAPE
jgi:heavy metal efflux system protein